jgi:hypothetical protein
MAKPDDKKAKRKLDDKLDQALRDTFPGSDPVSFTEPAPAKEQDVNEQDVKGHDVRGKPKRAKKG